MSYMKGRLVLRGGPANGPQQTIEADVRLVEARHTRNEIAIDGEIGTPAYYVPGVARCEFYLVSDGPVTWSDGISRKSLAMLQVLA